eukprot:4051748-Amphidinium_carterae.1
MGAVLCARQKCRLQAPRVFLLAGQNLNFDPLVYGDGSCVFDRGGSNLAILEVFKLSSRGSSLQISTATKDAMLLSPLSNIAHSCNAAMVSV